MADQYWNLLEAGDCNTAFGLLVDPAKTTKVMSAANLCRSIQISSVKSHQIVEITGQTSTSANVKVTVVRGGANPIPTSTMVMVVLGGAWRISDFLT